MSGDPVPGDGDDSPEKGGPRLIRVSVPEVRKLLLKLVWNAASDEAKVLAWSAWRRAHQYRARACHYRKRGARPPDD